MEYRSAAVTRRQFVTPSLGVGLTLCPAVVSGLGWRCAATQRDTDAVAKHLIDLDEATLGAARAELGTTTIAQTVNEALRRAAYARERRVAAALDVLGDAHAKDRSEAWR
jgi:Arc/MetJ family transcription regulator